MWPKRLGVFAPIFNEKIKTKDMTFSREGGAGRLSDGRVGPRGGPIPTRPAMQIINNHAPPRHRADRKRGARGRPESEPQAAPASRDFSAAAAARSPNPYITPARSPRAKPTRADGVRIFQLCRDFALGRANVLRKTLDCSGTQTRKFILVGAGNPEVHGCEALSCLPARAGWPWEWQTRDSPTMPF